MGWRVSCATRSSIGGSTSAWSRDGMKCVVDVRHSVAALPLSLSMRLTPELRMCGAAFVRM